MMKPFLSHRQWPMHRLLVLAASLLLGACASVPTSSSPISAAPAQFKENKLWQKADVDAPVTVPGAWWESFKDPRLDALEQQLLLGNEALINAATQVAAARAAVQASQSALWPSLSASAGGTRNANPATGSAASSVSNNFTLSASASWEVDIWGRLSQSASAAEARLQASQDDLVSARLSAQATLAQTYFSMRAAEAQLELLNRTETQDQCIVTLMQARYDAGVVMQSDVLQAQTQLGTVQVQIREAQIQRAQLEHAIAVLLGKPPSALDLASSAKLPASPPVPALLPSTLLEKRPDIAAAERRVAAAYRQIGVAQAAYFPALMLSASAGYRSSEIDQLVSAPNLLWSLGPTLALSIFDGGARKLASDQAQSAADQASSVYRQAVLTAFQEVEDNLVALALLKDELMIQQQSLQAARRNLDITLAQYQAGTVGYLSVASAQTTVLVSEMTLLSLRNRELAATNQLLKNLGGRWQDQTTP